MQRHLHIHFNDGDRLEVSFPEQGDSQTIATRVQKALEALLAVRLLSGVRHVNMIQKYSLSVNEMYHVACMVLA